MLHDNAGNSVVKMENPATMDQVSTIAGIAQGAQLRKEWRAEILWEDGKVQSIGQGGDVVCTSAGQTTRLVFDLMEPPQINTVGLSEDDIDAASNIESSASDRPSFKLSSRQDGSIISSSYSLFHLRVSRNVEFVQETAIDTVADIRRRETASSDGVSTGELHINITVDGTMVTRVSLERASIEGVLLPVVGRQGGTLVFEICLFEHHSRASERLLEAVAVCMAETKLLLETFSADTQLVQRRRSAEDIPSTACDVEERKSPEMIRVIFLVDLKVVDGYKLSTLHLAKHLPNNFQASTLDLSCACENMSGQLPRK